MGKNVRKDVRENRDQNNSGSQPEPLSGSKKVKNRNHSRQNKNPGHGL